MNIRKLAANAVSRINTRQAVTIKQSTGYTIAADGSQVPTYSTLTGYYGDVQALSGRDKEMLEGMNAQGVVGKIYLDGNFEGLFRKTGKGGDLIIYGGNTYLVTTVLERWTDWCCLALTMQLD